MTNKTFMSMVSDYGANPTQEGFDAIYAQYLADCRASASPAGVVKPLEWNNNAPSWYEADTIAGTYRIQRNAGKYAWSYDDEDVWHHGHHVDTLEAAKSAAFEDYSARIMSAIEPAGVGVETPPPQTQLVGGRWRVFEDTTPGYWGIELEAGNDDDAIMCPQKIHRDTVARIVQAHNSAVTMGVKDDDSSPGEHQEVLDAINSHNSGEEE